VATKNISLKIEAYNALKRVQIEGESFSDTIIGITANVGNLMDLWNKYQRLDEDEKELDHIVSTDT